MRAGPEISPDAVAASTAIRGIPLLLAHDLTGANAMIDAGGGPMPQRHRSPTVTP